MDNSMDASFRGMCRTCLTIDTNYHSIYDYAGDEMKICDMLDTILPQLLVLKRDELPNLICVECLDKLLIAYNFHQLCIESEGILWKILCGNSSIKLVDSGEVALRQPNSLQSSDQPIFKESFKLEVGEEEIQNSGIMVMLPNKEETAKDIQIEADSQSEDPPMDLSNKFINEIDKTDEEHKKEESNLMTLGKRNRLAKSKANEALTLTLRDKNNGVNDVKGPKISNNAKDSQKNTENSFPSNRDADQQAENPSECIQVQPKISARFICNVCSRKFKQMESLSAHLESHRKFDADVKNDISENTGKRKFQPISELSQHAPPNFKIRFFKCQFCDETFTAENDLNEHTTSKHNSIKPHEDKQSSLTFDRPFALLNFGKSLNSDSNLNQHKFALTDAEKHYQCSKCPSKFKTISDRNKHARTHRALEEHKCDFCDSTFKRANFLRLHMRRHKNELDRQRLQIIKYESQDAFE